MSENVVDLGFLEEPCSWWKLHRCFFPSKVGGKPAWLDPKNIPSVEEIKCQNCGEILVFLLQVYAPDDQLDHCFHRTVFVFCCKNGECYSEDSKGCLKSFCCSLPKENQFYPQDPPDYDSIDSLGSCADFQPLCNLCGCFGSKTCSKCKSTNYCSKQHQVMDWKSHKTFCAKNKSADEPKEKLSNFLFKESEILIESEENQEKKEASENIKSCDDCIQTQEYEFTEAELNEATVTQSEDKVFAKFKKRMDSSPDQILRYSKGSMPLWCSSVNIPNEDQIPDCICGSKRQFEFQITPQLLNFLNCDTSIEGATVDWGTIAIYTCSQNCLQTVYTPCFVWKQSFSAQPSTSPSL